MVYISEQNFKELKSLLKAIEEDTSQRGYDIGYPSICNKVKEAIKILCTESGEFIPRFKTNSDSYNAANLPATRGSGRTYSMMQHAAKLACNGIDVAILGANSHSTRTFVEDIKTLIPEDKHKHVRPITTKITNEILVRGIESFARKDEVVLVDHYFWESESTRLIKRIMVMSSKIDEAQKFLSSVNITY